MQAIKSSAQELRELIEDLVDTSRIVAGRLRLELRAVPLHSLLRSVVETLRLTAQEKQVVLEAEIAPAIGLVQADPGRIQQIAANLLSNAIKFTPAGGRVQVHARRDGDIVELSVADSGRGISATFLPHVFDRFRQADPISNRSEGGLGLGLAISKQLAELHGGTISAASDGEGHGATFTVRLPLPEIPASDSAARHTLSAVERLGERKVLLVEDSDATRRALSIALAEAGAIVTAVGTSEEALQEFQQQRFEVIVSDLGLPRVDGCELLIRIRRWEQEQGRPPVPALALTAFAGEKIQQRALECGFQRFLVKPVEPCDIVGALAALLS